MPNRLEYRVLDMGSQDSSDWLWIDLRQIFEVFLTIRSTMRYVTGRVTARPMNAETKLRMISSVVITMPRSPRMLGLSHLLKKIRGAASLEINFARSEPCLPIGAH